MLLSNKCICKLKKWVCGILEIKWWLKFLDGFILKTTLCHFNSSLCSFKQRKTYGNNNTVYPNLMSCVKELLSRNASCL